MADPISLPLSFKIYQKDASGKPIFLREQSFDQEVIKVGKGPAAALRLEDDSVALVHAYIQINAEKEVHVSDVVSKTGTFVNGEKINKAKLKSGDEIVLGNCMLVISFDSGTGIELAAPTGIPDGNSPEATAAVNFSADASAMATYSSVPVDVSSVEDSSKKQVVMVTTYAENKIVQNNVLMDHVHGEKPGILAYVAIGLGLILLLGGLFMGYKSVQIVHEQETVNGIIKEIAKDKGLSDKFVPKVKGDANVDLSFIILSLLGATIFITGLASIYKSKNILANYTVGEDPEATYPISSKDMPSPKFPLVKTDRTEGYHVLFSDNMEGSVTDTDGKKYMLTELVSMGVAQSSSEFSNVTDYPIPDNYIVEIRKDDYKWVIKSVNHPKLVLPFTFAKEMFYIQLIVWILFVGALAWYFNYIRHDELFSEDPDQKATVISKMVKGPMVVAKKKKEQKKQKVKDKDKQKDIYKHLKTKTKNDASAPRDPRTKASSGQGGAGVGFSRVSGPQGMGVANVLASQISAMTASLTASNTVFGQETENFDDMLGDGDPDGEAMDGGFGGRGGAGGGGGGGGLGIGGGGGSGVGGIGIGGGGGLGGRFGRMGGIGRRKIRIRSGSASVFGKLHPNEVRAVIRAHRREVHHCYQKGLMANDKLAGTVRVSFLINTSGRVNSCSVQENLAIPKVGNCICGRLRTWKFPQPQGGLARVAYAWTLQPGG